MGYFGGIFETDTWFEIVLIVVVDCKKSHVLMGTGVLNVNSICLVYAIISDPVETELLKDYKASIKLKENVKFSYFESHRLLINILCIVTAKLQKWLNKTFYNMFPLARSRWTSLIVVLRNVDLYICIDYKVSVNYICSDSYPTPNIESTLYSLNFLWKLILKLLITKSKLIISLKKSQLLSPP